MIEMEYRRVNIEPAVKEFSFRASGRSLTLNNVHKPVRIVSVKQTERAVGEQMVDPEASESIAITGVAIETESTLTDIAAAIISHLSYRNPWAKRPRTHSFARSTPSMDEYV